jgi:hypothetical protein
MTVSLARASGPRANTAGKAPRGPEANRRGLKRQCRAQGQNRVGGSLKRVAESRTAKFVAGAPELREKKHDRRNLGG